MDLHKLRTANIQRSRVLNAQTREPAEYVVTRVAAGMVYYKQRDERKARECTPASLFGKIVKQ
jgi:hypothetical protein